MLSDQQRCEARECSDDATGFDSYMKMWLCDHHGGREDSPPASSPSDVERAATLAWNEAIEQAADIATQAKREAHARRGNSGGQDYLRAEGELQVASSIAEDIRALKRPA